MLSFHTTVHGCSFKSVDCTTAIVKTFLNHKFTCCHTKTKEIVTKVAAPVAMKQVMIDSSNRLSLKPVPLLFKCDRPEKGVMMKA